MTNSLCGMSTFVSSNSNFINTFTGLQASVARKEQSCSGQTTITLRV